MKPKAQAAAKKVMSTKTDTKKPNVQKNGLDVAAMERMYRTTKVPVAQIASSFGVSVHTVGRYAGWHEWTRPNA